MLAAFLLVMFWNGDLPEILIAPAPSIELCWEAVPDLRAKLPPRTLVLCVELQTAGAGT